MSLIRGTLRSLCRVTFDTYEGGLVMMRSNFDWNICILLVLDFLAETQIWIP